MSVEENKALVREFVEEVLNKRNLGALEKFIAADYREHNPPPRGTGGLEDLRGGMTLFLGAFPDLHMTVEDQVGEGDKVASRFTTRGTQRGELFGVPPSGQEVVYSTIDIARFAGGKIVERWGLDDQLGVLQQLGVVPPPQQTS